MSVTRTMAAVIFTVILISVFSEKIDGRLSKKELAINHYNRMFSDLCNGPRPQVIALNTVKAQFKPSFTILQRCIEAAECCPQNMRYVVSSEKKVRLFVFLLNGTHRKIHVSHKITEGMTRYQWTTINEFNHTECRCIPIDTGRAG